MRDYKKAALDYIDKYLNIIDDFASGIYSDINHLAEFLSDTIEIEYRDGMTDTEYEKEADRQTKEIYKAIEEHADEIKKGLLIRRTRG